MKWSEPRQPAPGHAHGLFYTRDSGGKHLVTPPAYVNWAAGECAKRGLKFDGTGEKIDAMIREGVSVSGDLYLDWDVKGNQMVRRALEALFQRLREDPNVTHVLIPRRDRLARPDDIADGIALETKFRRELGVYIVYDDKVLAPIGRGAQTDIGQMIGGYVDFHKAEQERRDLAKKTLNAQPVLASQGFSPGGRAPYGFCRWLVGPDLKPIRQLSDGEIVRQPGNHVSHLQALDGTFEIRLKILRLLRQKHASQVAAQLNKEGVATPDSRRSRRDNGVVHQTSGFWHDTTITNIGRDPINAAINEYGRRSMGDKQRFSRMGPRDLVEGDYRADGKPKVIRNGDDQVITGPCHFPPLLPESELSELKSVLEQRAGNQRGRPKIKDPDKNPLGGRIFDMDCSWLMYLVSYKVGFKYRCGYYAQSNGHACEHNQVDGPTAVRLIISGLRQRILIPDLKERLRQKVRAIADHEQGDHRAEETFKAMQSQVKELDKKIEKAATNMALAESSAHLKAMAKAFDGLAAEKALLEANVTELQRSIGLRQNVDEEVEQAMQNFGNAEILAAAALGNLASARLLFELTNARLFVSFRSGQWGKRTVRKVAGGILCLGSQPNPIEVYSGPTSKRAISDCLKTTNKNAGECSSAAPSVPISSQGEDSLGKLHRGDKI